jgi:hypothetical protein
LDDPREGLIPLYGFLEGDTLGLLVLAYRGDTIAQLADRLQQSARVRVAYRESVKLVYKGRVLPPELTVETAGIEPLERFDVMAAGEG